MTTGTRCSGLLKKVKKRRMAKARWPVILSRWSGRPNSVHATVITCIDHGDVQGVSRRHAVRGKKEHPLCGLLEDYEKKVEKFLRGILHFFNFQICSPPPHS